MRAVLKDFQSAAVEKLSRSLRRMTRGYWEGGRLSATCLAAPTGASRMQGRPARGLGGLTAIAKTHGLSLSAFFRLAADEYIANHDW